MPSSVTQMGQKTNFIRMKTRYFSPEVQVDELELEDCFLQSTLSNPGIGSLGDPEDEDPWGNN